MDTPVLGNPHMMQSKPIFPMDFIDFAGQIVANAQRLQHLLELRG